MSEGDTPAVSDNKMEQQTNLAQDIADINLELVDFFNKMDDMQQTMKNKWKAFNKRFVSSSIQAAETASTPTKPLDPVEPTETPTVAAADDNILERMDGEAPKIKLNIGGTSFHTTVSTLLSEPDSFFCAMLRSGCWKPDAEGEYFIDRSPQMFPMILEYLRTRQVNTDHLSDYERRLLVSDVDFYQVRTFPPCSQCKFTSDDIIGDDTVTISNMGHTLHRTAAHKTLNRIYTCTVLQPSMYSGNIVKWKFSAHTTHPSKVIPRGAYVGIGPATNARIEDTVLVNLTTGKLGTCNTFSPFIEWGSEETRVVHFTWNQDKQQITVSACGHENTVNLPTIQTYRAPLVWCNTYARDTVITVE
eukprot:TRINITY_DN68030_c6_g1_i1.p1 TRINITY_DN68030_c6_g1~~TRINITY_DN68030_c6_g1_i1.p1  ORF type:complete len:360 (-),score=33.98 TRINITY_DN68030_c6_g1_i1:106-1185(-)